MLQDEHPLDAVLDLQNQKQLKLATVQLYWVAKHGLKAVGWYRHWTSTKNVHQQP